MKIFPYFNESGFINSTDVFNHETAVPEWSEIVLIIYMLITAIFAICGNGIIILVEIKNRCKTSTDWLVSCMALNDFIFAAINIPIHVSLHVGTWKAVGSDGSCKIHVYVEKVTQYSSTLLLCTVALDRYWKTCKPHDKFLTPQRAFRVCVLITIISCIVSSPLLKIVVYSKPSECDHIKILRGALIAAMTGLVLLTFIGMYIIVCVCYTKVALTIKRKLMKNNEQFPNKTYKDLSSGSSALEKSTQPTTSKKIRSWRIRFGRITKVAPSVAKDQNGWFAQIQTANDSNQERLFDRSSSSTESKPGGPLKSAPNSNTKPAFNNFRPVEPNTKPAFSKFRQVESRVDRTTKIMFAVTVVFLLSWVPSWIVMFFKQLVKQPYSVSGKVLIMFGEKAFMVNTFTNPIFYISLSSAFKERAKKELKNLFKCRRSRR